MRRLFLVAMVLTLCANVAAAQQEKKAGPSIAEWLKGLQNRIAQIVPQKTIQMSNGVAGVRGAKEDAQVKLYWKGKKDEAAVTEEEMAKFKSGVDLATRGDKEGSLKQLEEFMKQYPDSALIPDAKKTFDLVKVMPAPEPNAEEKSDSKAEPKPEEKKEEKKTE